MTAFGSPRAGAPLRGAGLSVERLRREGEEFFRAISREYYESGAGLKLEPALQPVYAAHAQILGDDALALVLERFRDAAEGSEEHRSSRMLADWLVEAQSARALAPLDERQLAWEASAMVTLPDGRQLAYQRASIEMANAADRRERLAVERARGALIQRELAPMRLERLQRERDITMRLGLAPSYRDTWELLSGIRLEPLRAQCEAFLRDTAPMWDDVLAPALRKTLGITRGEATRGDALAFFRVPGFDAAFPPTAMQDAVLRQVREMGVDPLANGRVRLDTAERDGKRARAFCAPVRVPEEVHLVLRPMGGQRDWGTFLHELGHALHFAYMRPDLPAEYRWLGDNSVTEGFAMLFDHRMHDAKWLGRYTGLGTKVPEFRRTIALEELHFVRRYCAKLLYELELMADDVNWRTLPDRYVQLLTDATGFQYDASEALVDVDRWLYVVRYLRAWQLQALFNDTLTERYDDDWWRNPRAGPWIVSALWGEGQRELADEMAMRVSGKPLDFAPVIRAIEAMLA
ncbi:MAG: gluzincin family metallopeptidase [Gemmatimonadaceae bacterium]